MASLEFLVLCSALLLGIVLVEVVVMRGHGLLAQVVAASGEEEVLELVADPGAMDGF